MKRMKRKLLAILMSLTMVFTMIPMMSAPVYADDPAPAAIYLANNSAPFNEGGQKHIVYFGHYPQSEVSNVDELTKDVDYVEVGNNKYLIEPIKWRVLGNPVDPNGNPFPELVLLSDQNLDCKQYHEQNTSITWEGSTIRKWLNDGFMKVAFSPDEGKAIRTTRVRNKKSVEYTPNPYYEDMDGSNDTMDQIFLLSINDAQNDAYGFTNDRFGTETRKAKNTAYAIAKGISSTNTGNGHWWLRSPGIDGLPSLVIDDGAINYYGPSIDTGIIGVRPAFNLELSSALFTSAAVGGKSSGDVGAGSLESVGTNSSNEWKLTVEDDTHKDFKVDEAWSCDGKNLYIEYSGAVPGDNEYISAIIKNENNVIKYYGKLAEVSDSGKATVNFDGKMSKGDTLCIFNEQCNDDFETDFSSPLQETEILYIEHDWKAATCTEPEICKYCGTKCGPPIGHKYGAWTKLNATQHQKVCQHDKSHVIKENHKWDAGKVTKAATTAAEGVKTFTCVVCKVEKTETIAKLTPKPTTKPAPAPKVSGAPTAKMKAGKTSITMAWNKIEGADGYDIFFARCNHDGKKIVCKNVKSIKGNKTFTWKKSGLKSGTAYKAYVKAYVMKNGKKTYVKTSPMMHAYTGNGTKKYTNAKSVTIKNVKKGKLSLKRGKTFKIKAKVNKLKKNKKLMTSGHAPTLRYMTTNSKVATVSKKGKITAKGKGTCTIYVYAHNGVYKSIKVTVK